MGGVETPGLRGRDPPVARLPEVMSAPSPLLPWPVVLCAALALAACSSTPKPKKADYAPVERWDEDRVRLPEKPIGPLLAQLDGLMRNWTTLALTASDPLDDRRREALESDLRYRVSKRFDELVAELEAGPPSNRQVAAMALGFSATDRALSPLLAALHDARPEVRSNALTALGLLALRDTPLERVRELVESDPHETVRIQGALALRKIIQTGAPTGDAELETARNGILDPSPGVRSECCLILGLLRDEESIDLLGQLLRDPTPLPAAAAARSLQMIGTEDSRQLGPTARALASSLDDVDGNVRQTILKCLMTMSRSNFGERSEGWIEWANRLP